MRVLLDANILSDCLILETTGLPRPGKAASERLLECCDTGVHVGLVAWHTLPILAYYYGQQHSAEETGAMIDGLLAMLEVPAVAHRDATGWRTTGVSEFEDALQVVCAIFGSAGVIVSRNIADFAAASVPVMTPEDFFAAFP